MTDIDFLGDARREVLSSLPYDRKNSSLVAELEAMPLVDLLRVYFNWRRRLIRPVPRSVHVSRELTARRLSGRRARVVAEILRALERGGDLTHRLSGSVARDGYSLRSSSKTPDKDRLLVDWGVHHLHLGGPRKGERAFSRRTDALLFVAVRPTDAYVIDLLDHASFDDAALAKIIIRNWPHSGLAYPLHGVLIGGDPSSAERRVWRKAGMMAPVVVDGTPYIFSPVTTAGTAATDSQAASALFRLISDVERQIRDDPGHVVRLIQMAGIECPVVPASPCFAFFENGAYGIYDTTNDVGIGLGYF